MNKILLTIIFLSFQLEASRVIERTIFSYWDKPDIDIFYSVPETISEESKILFIMHGGSRSAESYITDWLPLAENRNVVLIAPKFSKEFYKEYVYLMKSNEKGRAISDPSLDLENSLGLLFDFFSSKLKLTNKSFRLYGHSGGSQFVHRYLLLSEELRIDKAAMANAGFYTFVDDSKKYPFGIKGMRVSDDRLEWFLRLKAGVFLTDQDNDPRQSNLPSMRKVRKQGKNRLQRGNNFFNHLIKLGTDRNISFRWRYHIVQGVAHDNSGMSAAASSFLLEDL